MKTWILKGLMFIGFFAATMFVLKAVTEIVNFMIYGHF